MKEDMGSRYRRGANFERRVRHIFEEDGYQCWRSAGSKSPADIICLRRGELILIQCQTNSYFPPGKRQQLEELVRENNCQGRLVHREGRGKIVMKTIG